MNLRFDAVLFDLDGTLIDSAPDLAAAANEMRASRGLAPVAYGALRHLAGSGARGMLAGAFGLAPGAESYAEMREEFLDRYERLMLQSVVVFPQVPAMLSSIEAAEMPWGIVTNKAERFAKPVVAHVSALAGSSTLVGGDTTAHAKPHPAPLLEAARRLGVEPARCVYVGDDLRDVTAGRAAGMATVAAAWGYLGAGEGVAAWPADIVIQEPNALLNWLIHTREAQA